MHKVCPNADLFGFKLHKNGYYLIFNMLSDSSWVNHRLEQIGSQWLQSRSVGVGLGFLYMAHKR